MQMLMMREDGVKISKGKLFDRKNPRHKGRCLINEMQDIYTRRVMTIAIFNNSPDLHDGHRLLDARMVWMNEEGRFMLTGIERKKTYMVLKLNMRNLGWCFRTTMRRRFLREGDASRQEAMYTLQWRYCLWGRPGFDRGCKAAQGIPRAGHLVNTTGKYITANDNSYALAA